MKIGFLGAGKLGLPCAVSIAAKGHHVLSYDINDKINSSVHPKDVLYTYEADETGKNTIGPMIETTTLKFVDTVDEIIYHSEIIFVAIQTPHQSKYEGHVPIPDEREDFDYTWLINCMKDLSMRINEKKVNKIVSIISTVLPGTLRRDILPITSSYIKLCYNPYFIAMGSVVRDFYHPEFILLGTIDIEAENKVKEFYKTITKCDVYACSLENAEMIKVSYNTFITTKIVMANNIMEMCNSLPNTNVDVVMGALKKGTDRLISPAYLDGGMGDGGGCHPRDNIAMSWLSNKLNIDNNYYDFIMRKRESQTAFFIKLIKKQKEENKELPLCILGTAFKPNTNIKVGSPSVLLSNLLREEKIEFESFDPNIINDNENSDPPLKTAKIYFIGCKHDVFKTYVFPTDSVVIDPHRYIEEQPNVKLIQVGVGNSNLLKYSTNYLSPSPSDYANHFLSIEH